MEKKPSYQLTKYSARHHRTIKKTINPNLLNDEEIEKIKKDFIENINEDNKKFKDEIKALKMQNIIPKKTTWKTTKKLLKEQEQQQSQQQEQPQQDIKIETKEIIPSGEINMKIEIENGETKIKEEEIKKIDNKEIKITKKTTSSNVDNINETNLMNIMNNEDIIKNIENKSGNTFLLVGASKSGKTTYLINLVNHLNDLYKSIYKKPIIILFSETMANDHGIYNKLNGAILYDKYDESIINTVIKIQKKTNKKYPIIIILDDVINKQNPTISKLFTIYRNLNISSIICLQRLKMFSKNDRSNVNYIFGLKMNTSEAIEDMINIFFKGILNHDDYITLTKDYNKIYLDNLNNKIYKLKS